MKLLGTPYRKGGREPGEGLDCLGVVLCKASAMGLPLRDPWEVLREYYRDALRYPAHFFGEGWRRLGCGDQLQDGDVLVTKLGVAILEDGLAWTSSPETGVYRLADLAHREAWRYDP